MILNSIYIKNVTLRIHISTYSNTKSTGHKHVNIYDELSNLIYVHLQEMHRTRGFPMNFGLHWHFPVLLLQAAFMPHPPLQTHSIKKNLNFITTKSKILIKI